MRIGVQRGPGPVENRLLDALAGTCRRLGHEVVHDGHQNLDVAIVWNGRRFWGTCPTVCCELGWLPRWGYQVSWGGINGNHHASPWRWNGRKPSNAMKERVRAHLAQVRMGNPHGWSYTQIKTPANLPEQFILCPLQIETDTNMSHVARELRTMAAFVRAVAQADLPYPVVYKQHPAQRPALRELPIRAQDIVLPADAGTVYGILQDPGCQAVITLNSNTAHDALLYEVPSIVLGRNVWPEETGPFFVGLPATWKRFLSWQRSVKRRDSTWAYIDHLRTLQWTDARARDEGAVTELLEQTVANYVPISYRDKVNVVAESWGWLFDDLLARYRDCPDVICTEKPIDEALAYMFIRTHEGSHTPDPSRTVVQMHDFFPMNTERRAAIGTARGVVMVHPDQAELISPDDKHLLVQPIGASTAFRVRDTLGPGFRVAWVGRPSAPKRVERFVRIMGKAKRHVPDLVAVLIGDGLEGMAQTLKQFRVPVEIYQKAEVGYDAYPALYRTLDALVICSETEAGPLTLFEALASGVPVMSTRVGWAPRLIHDGINGHLIDGADVPRNTDSDAALTLRHMARDRDVWFSRRHAIRGTLMGWTLENWLAETVAFAKEIGHAADAEAG